MSHWSMIVNRAKGLGGLISRPYEDWYTNPFSSGLFSCCENREACCMFAEACCCPSCTVGAIHNVWLYEFLGEDNSGKVCACSNDAACQALVVDLLLPCFCLGTRCTSVYTRSFVVQKYQLQETSCGGGECAHRCLIPYCCFACSNVQVARHLMANGSVPESASCFTGDRQLSSTTPCPPGIKVIGGRRGKLRDGSIAPDEKEVRRHFMQTGQVMTGSVQPTTNDSNQNKSSTNIYHHQQHQQNQNPFGNGDNYNFQNTNNQQQHQPGFVTASSVMASSPSKNGKNIGVMHPNYL